jgi:hypothetical protein
MTHILTAEDIEEDDGLQAVYCPKCLERGYQNRLGPKILMVNEPKGEDYEDWYECTECCYIHHYVEIPATETIEDTIEKQSSPYEDRLQLVSVPTRAAEKGLKPRKRGKRTKKDKNKLHDDPEINELMRIYGNRVKVVYDSGP